MAFRPARGDRPVKSPRGSRSASPSWNEGASAPSRRSRGAPEREPPSAGPAEPRAEPYAPPSCYDVGDYVAYVGPNYTFPGTGVTLRHGMEGEVVGHGTNVPTQYASHAFLSIKFFGHSTTTNVPPDALAPCFRPPGSGPWAAPGSSSASSLRGVPDFLESPRITPRGEREKNDPAQELSARREQPRAPDSDPLDCCAGPRPPRGENGRPERGGCDVLSFFDALFSDDANLKTATSPSSQKGAVARKPRER